MSTLESVPHSLELELYKDQKADKRELLDEHRHNLAIRVYWLRLTNSVSMQLINEHSNRATEFIIPNDQVLQARDHPMVYAQRAGVEFSLECPNVRDE